MTTQNAKISRRSNRSVHHFNREGKGFHHNPLYPPYLKGGY
jgi:hypothetical protein